jgi:hypothetical protein
MLGNNQRSSRRGRRGRSNPRFSFRGRRANQRPSRATPTPAGAMAGNMVGQRTLFDPTASLNSAISSGNTQGPMVGLSGPQRQGPQLFDPSVLNTNFQNAPQPAGTTGMLSGPAKFTGLPQGPATGMGPDRTIGRGAGAFAMRGRGSVRPMPQARGRGRGRGRR